MARELDASHSLSRSAGGWPLRNGRRLPGAVTGLVASALGLGLVTSTPASAQTTARDTLPIVRRIDIEGNSAFSDDQIKRAIATRESGCRSAFLSPFCWIGIGAFQRRVRLDPRELRTDVARIRIFYYRRGYRRAQVDTSLVREAGSVDVTFKISEGEPISVRSVQVRGLDELPNPRAIVSGLPIQVDSAYSEVRLTAAREQIERRLRNRGYAEAVVLLQATIPGDDSLGAHVTLEALPGPPYRFGEIEVEGASQLEARDVKRLLTFRTGDTYSEDAIVRSQRTLYSMALFDYVDITAAPSVVDSSVSVRVQVNEADMRSLQFGTGVSTTECLQLQTSWTHRNFGGGTRRLELTGVLSNIATAQLAQTFPCNQAGDTLSADRRVRDAFNAINWRLRADFRRPWFLGTQNSLDLGLFSERQSLPSVYARLSYGGDVRLSRELSPGTAVFTTYRAGRDRLEEGSADFLFCANFGVCSPDDIETLSETRWLNWITFAIARSHTDAVLSPTRGYRFTLEGEHGSKRLTGSDWAYYRAQGQFSWYQRLGSGRVLALRLRGGMVRPIGSGIEDEPLSLESEPVTQPLKRQYAGGAYTVRGYGQNLLGPKVLLLLTDRPDEIAEKLLGCSLDAVEENSWVCDPNAPEQDLSSSDFAPRPIGGENSVVANVELRFPLGSDRWTGVTFVDFGRVWTAGTLGAAEDFQWSPGIGIRYRSPVGPVRLDVGYNTSDIETLPVVVAIRDEEARRTDIVQLVEADGSTPELFEYDPLGGFFSRLQLHFSIGQAF